MEILMIRPSELTEFTVLGGNIDVDKYLPCILDVQRTVIEPLIGTEKYLIILDGIENANLSVDNQLLLDDYLKPILKHQTCAEYVEIASYVVANGGIFKHQPKDSTIVDKSEVQYLAQIQRSKAQRYIDRYTKKYGCLCDENSTGSSKTNLRVSSGWHL
jgi:hypothetical protein